MKILIRRKKAIVIRSGQLIAAASGVFFALEVASFGMVSQRVGVGGSLGVLAMMQVVVVLATTVGLRAQPANEGWKAGNKALLAASIAAQILGFSLLMVLAGVLARQGEDATRAAFAVVGAVFLPVLLRSLDPVLRGMLMQLLSGLRSKAKVRYGRSIVFSVVSLVGMGVAVAGGEGLLGLALMAGSALLAIGQACGAYYVLGAVRGRSVKADHGASVDRLIETWAWGMQIIRLQAAVGAMACGLAFVATLWIPGAVSKPPSYVLLVQLLLLVLVACLGRFLLLLWPVLDGERRRWFGPVVAVHIAMLLVGVVLWRWVLMGGLPSPWILAGGALMVVGAAVLSTVK